MKTKSFRNNGKPYITYINNILTYCVVYANMAIVIRIKIVQIQGFKCKFALNANEI